MENKKLTGIERDLVLQYLIDGNVPVTLTPVMQSSQEKTEGEDIKSVSPVVFPVAIKAEKISVNKDGWIFLKNIDSSFNEYIDKTVKVEFYFNRVGLFFESVLKSTENGLAIELPLELNRISNTVEDQKYDFSAVLYYSVNSNRDMNFKCIPAAGFNLFEKPVWSSIPLEKQQKAKNYLENYVNQAKQTRKAGNGIQLINICRFVVDETHQFEEIEGIAKPFKILFVDHERIVLAYEKNDSLSLDKQKEYALKMSFVLKEKIKITRDIYVTFVVDAVYTNDEGTKICADCSFSSIQTEDERFLYEKTTHKLFA